MRKIFLQSVIALSAITAFMSCSKDIEAFNASAIEEKQKNDYTSSFVAKYGPIDSNQSWDFTTGERRLATRGATTISTTIMENGISWGDVSKIKTVKQDDDAWNHTNIVIENDNATEKNGALLNAMVKALPEGRGQNGKPVVLVAPSSGFWIYPLFSGGLLTYDLKVKVGDQAPVTVFTKDWINFQTVNGMKKVINKNGEYVEAGTVNMKGVYIEAPVGTAIEVYIDNIYCYTKAAGNAYEKAFPSPAGTTNGRAIYVDIDEGIRPEIEGVTLKENAVIKYIGIEDISAGAPLLGDNDFNDLVLAVIGNPDVPQEKIITEDHYEVKTCVPKRYMIEDLGSIGDFDFNDIVVDVEDYTVETHKVSYENGVIKTDEVESTKSAPSKAVIRALGGTIDFELQIGDTKWKKSENGFEVTTMYNTQGTIDYDKVLAEFEVSGWNAGANNISVTVTEKSGDVCTITFPKKGTAPMIIAVDPTQKWMGERKSVPSSWFYTE